jgi:hypothetical protein
MMQPEAPSDVLVGKLVELGVVIVDNVIFLVPAVMAAGAVFVVAWFNKRTKRLKKDVRDAAVEAEKQHGRHAGPKKHAFASSKLKKTWSSIDTHKLDDLITTEGVKAAHEYRDSLVPPEPKK